MSLVALAFSEIARVTAAQQVYWPDFRFRFVTGL
jgi:hypothetical protein